MQNSIATSEKKSQVSVEYITLTAFLIMVLAIVFIYAQIALQDSVTVSRISTAIKKIASAAEQAYALGPGTKLIVEVEFPQNIQNISISENEINANVSISSGTTQIYEYTDAKLTGSITPYAGLQQIPVSVLQNGVVLIGASASEDHNAPITTLLAPPNNYTTSNFTVQFDYNTFDANSSIYACKLIINGSVDQVDYSVDENTTQSFTKTFSASGTYTWDINCIDNSANFNEASSINGPRTLHILHLDTEPPIVYLISPEDGNVWHNTIVSFDYNVFDAMSDINHCQLLLKDIMDDYVAAYWKFDETSGQSINDESANNNDGYLGMLPTNDVYDPSRVGGKFNNGLEFNGDYVTIPNSSSLSPTSEITLEAWIYPYSSTGLQSIISKRYNLLMLEFSYALAIDATNRTIIGIVRTSTQNICTSSAGIINFDEWQHIAMSYDGYKMKLWKNGTVVGECNISGQITYNPLILTILIGATDLGMYAFHGKIDEVRVSNHARPFFNLSAQYLDFYTTMTDYSVDENVTQTFDQNIYWNWRYQWDVNCTDDSSNYNHATSQNGPFTLQLSIIYATDDFESGTTSGGKGWLTNWNLTGNATITTAGTPHSGSYHLRLRKTATATRTLNLKNATRPKLRFWRKLNSLENGDYAYVKVSPDGTTWHTIATYTNGDDDNIYHLEDVDLRQYYENSSQFYISFESAFSSSADYFYIDDVEVVEG